MSGALRRSAYAEIGATAQVKMSVEETTVTKLRLSLENRSLAGELR